MNAGVSSFSALGRRLRHVKRQWLVALGALLVTGTAFAATAAGAPAGDPNAVAEADAAAIAPPSGTGSAAAPPRTARSPTVSPLDRRIALLARELDLDAIQQLKVKAVLESQREQVARVWQDESAPGALRVKRTQLISERTEDGIRSLLTDEQKKKYFKPRTADVAVGGTPADLASWMDAVSRR